MTDYIKAFKTVKNEDDFRRGYKDALKNVVDSEEQRKNPDYSVGVRIAAMEEF